MDDYCPSKLLSISYGLSRPDIGGFLVTLYNFTELFQYLESFITQFGGIKLKVSKSSPTLLEQNLVCLFPRFLVTTAVLSTQPKLCKVAAFCGNILDLLGCQKMALT
jgi:hypothetical protein